MNDISSKFKKIYKMASKNFNGIAILCHIYYEDLWDEVADYISNAPGALLFFSVALERKKYMEPVIRRRFPNSHVEAIKNQGSDIYPFLKLMEKVVEYKEIKLVCKIHTKRGSTNYPDVWRSVLLDGVLGSIALVREILAKFGENENLTMAGAGCLWKSADSMMFGNAEKIRELMPAIPLPHPDKDWPFLAGTMFWSTISVIKPFLSLTDESRFLWGSHRTDGKLAHAVERLFGWSATANGGKIGLVDAISLKKLEERVVIGSHDEGLDKFMPSSTLASCSEVYREEKKWKSARIFDDNFYKGKYPSSQDRHIRSTMHYVMEGKSIGYAPNPISQDILKKSISEVIKESNLFDSEYYLNEYPDVASAKVDPFSHYLRFGQNSRNPNALFLTKWYVEQSGAMYHSSPLIDYLLSCASGLSKNTHPLFDSSWYAFKYIKTQELLKNPLAHYLKIGIKIGCKPHPMYTNIQDKRGRTDLYNPSASPILSRIPPTKYLSAACPIKPKLTKSFSTLEEFIEKSALNQRIIQKSLTENDLRIVGMMDNRRELMAAKYEKSPQSELASIIMPTMNRAKLIPIAISSILNQTYKNWELIVVDDGGSDNTEIVIDSFAEPRIKYVRHNNNKGNAAARNTGLRESSGSVISYLDDDDQWDPEFLKISIGAMRERKTIMGYSAQVVWEGFNSVVGLGNKFSFIRFSQYNRSLLENSNYISMISCVHDRSTMEEHGLYFDETLSRLVDWDYFLKITEICSPIAIPCLLSHYYTNHSPSSITKSYDTKIAIESVQKKLIERAGGCEILSTAHGDLKIFPNALKEKSITITNFTNIIIPNHECYEELFNCLKSIERNTKIPYRIILVDNLSKSQTRDRLALLPSKFNNLTYLTADDEAGFSFAVNEGLRYVFENLEGDILILNNDVYTTEGWLDELHFVLLQHEDVGMAVPRQVLPPDHEISLAHVPVANCELEVDINLSAHHNNIINTNFNVHHGFFELSYAPMFCALIRRSVAETVGFLDARNGPHYRSDWIYCEAVRNFSGNRIVYTPNSKVYHLQGVSTRVQGSIGG